MKEIERLAEIEEEIRQRRNEVTHYNRELVWAKSQLEKAKARRERILKKAAGQLQLQGVPSED